jgi:hypothetical protein
VPAGVVPEGEAFMSCQTIHRLTMATIALVVLAAASAVQAAPITFKGLLDGPSENPPNASPGTGNATVVFDIVAHTMQVSVSFTGLIGNTTAAHIHCCTASPMVNVPPSTTTPTFPGFPLGVTAGVYSQLFDMTLLSSYNLNFVNAQGGTVAQAEAALFAGLQAGQAYFNIHSTAFGGGEIRGFLTQVPEPATLGLVVLGLAGLGVVARRHNAG